MSTFLLTQILALIVIIGISIYIYTKRKILGFWITTALYLFILGGTAYISIKNYPKYWIGYHLTMKVKSQFVAEQEIGPGEYLEDFHEICDIVESYYMLAKPKGISLKALREKYSAMVNDVKNNSEYFIVIQQYFSELKNSHTNLRYKKYTALANAEWRCDSLYVTVNLTNLPIRTGDKILSIDGINALSWRDSMMHYVTASTKKGRHKHTADYVFSSYIDTLRTLCLCRKDSVFQVKVGLRKDGLQLISNYNKETGRSEKKRILDSSQKEEHFTYLTLSGFTDEDTDEFILKYEKVRNSPCIVLNLQNNSGGLVRNMEKIAALLLKRAYPSENIILPSKNAFKGKLYVLIGSYTCSAAEHLASLLKESKSAILVGEETAGDFGTTPLTFCTSHDTYFCVGFGKPKKTFKGKPREGKGVEPHYQITEEALLSNSHNTLRKTFMLIMNDAIEAKKIE